MSNIFRDSESLGKSNGKKWSQNNKKKQKKNNIWCRIAAQFKKKNLFSEFRLNKSLIINLIKS